MLAHPGPERTIHGPTLTHHRTQVVHAGWPTLIDLKRRWQVSLAALLPRAKNLGRMTDASYFTAVKALSARGWRRQEPIPIAPREPRRLLQIVGANGGDGVSKAMPRHIVDAIAGANLP